RLRAAGGIVLGKVQTTQFAGRDPTRTRNPWNLSRTASGSSSGSAVSVAARMVPVSVATQTGGSIIRPAAYLGGVGFSPTHGRVRRACAARAAAGAARHAAGDPHDHPALRGSGVAIDAAAAPSRALRARTARTA